LLLPHFITARCQANLVFGSRRLDVTFVEESAKSYPRSQSILLVAGCAPRLLIGIGVSVLLLDLNDF
jgi:hypothetical protein